MGMTMLVAIVGGVVLVVLLAVLIGLVVARLIEGGRDRD